MSDRGGSMRGRPRGGGGGRDRGSGGSMRGHPGDRGGGRGGRGGDRGDRGGGGRGGRGGFDGGRGGRGAKVIYSPRSIPEPNQTVKKIEDKYESNMKDPLDLQKLSLADSQFPLRPYYGTGGKRVLLRTNYFDINVDHNLGLNRYRIEVSPSGGKASPSGKQLKWIIKLFLEQHLDAHRGRIATDYGSTLISRQPLEVKDATFDVRYRFEEDTETPENPRFYRVRVQHTGTVTAAALLDYLASSAPNATLAAKEEIVQALNIIVGHHPKSQPNFLTVAGNKHYIADPADNFDLGNGLEALRGYFVSVRPATARLLVNVQVKHTACFSAGPLPAIVDTWKGGPQKLHKFLKRVRVRVTHLNRNGRHPIKTLVGLATRQDGRQLAHPPRITGPPFGSGPKQVEFYRDDPSGSAQQPAIRGGSVRGRGRGKGKGPAAPPASEGEYVSVFEYFRQEYKISVNPNRPVVNFGSGREPKYVPAELCEVVPGQPSNTKLDSFQTSKMINFAVRTPADNAASIVQDGLHVIGASPTPIGMLGQMGLNLTPQMITVMGRVLSSPTVHYTPKHPIKNIQDASWNLMDVKEMSNSVKLPEYAVLHFRDGPRDNEQFDAGRMVDDLAEFASRYGMGRGKRVKSVEHVLDLRPDVETDSQVDNGFAKAIASSPAPKLVFVILPAENTPVYNRIKFNGDIQHGIHTICMVRSKLTKGKPGSYFGNQVPKLNLKLGGTNQILFPADLGIVTAEPTMVVGLDVTHPSPGSLNTAPSIAAMVASVDRTLAQWPAIIRLQHQARNEMVDDLRGMLETRLRIWQKKNNNTLPSNILVYRDGVSEGQYNKVLELELPLLRECCRKVYPSNAIEQGFPRISIIIVGKRHHTRFYPVKEEDADSASNPKSGTIVDRGVTENRNWNFFLQAHKALKGTARPAHYFVILDEIFRQVKDNKAGPVDRLEDLTHRMCYLFGRATKAVSICPPAYYADLVCDRARRYLSHQYDSTPDESVVSGQTSAAGPGNDDVLIHPNLANSMFYM